MLVRKTSHNAISFHLGAAARAAVQRYRMPRRDLSPPCPRLQHALPAFPCLRLPFAAPAQQGALCGWSHPYLNSAFVSFSHDEYFSNPLALADLVPVDEVDEAELAQGELALFEHDVLRAPEEA